MPMNLSDPAQSVLSDVSHQCARSAFATAQSSFSDLMALSRMVEGATVGVHKWAVDEAFVVVAERG